ADDDSRPRHHVWQFVDKRPAPIRPRSIALLPRFDQNPGFHQVLRLFASASEEIGVKNHQGGHKRCGSPICRKRRRCAGKACMIAKEFLVELEKIRDSFNWKLVPDTHWHEERRSKPRLRIRGTCKN